MKFSADHPCGPNGQAFGMASTRNWHSIVGANGMCECGVKADGTIVTCGALLAEEQAAALLRLPRVSQEDRWQPIATAPNDGTWFLAWDRDCEYTIQRRGHGFIAAEEPDATHWMLLPLPPLADEGATRPLHDEKDLETRGGTMEIREGQELPQPPTGVLSATAPDLEWAIARLRKNQAIAESNAGMYGAKLLKGHGYPDEVMCDAQDALAYRIVLAELADLQGRIANAFA